MATSGPAPPIPCARTASTPDGGAVDPSAHISKCGVCAKRKTLQVIAWIPVFTLNPSETFVQSGFILRSYSRDKAFPGCGGIYNRRPVAMEAICCVSLGTRRGLGEWVPGVSTTPSRGQTPTCVWSPIYSNRHTFVTRTAPFRPVFTVSPGAHARPRRRIRQSRRKNAGFTAMAQPSRHTSPVAALARKFETG
jgi:hypothetical protein